MKTVLLISLCLVLATAGVRAGEAPLPPGKPAGVRPAGMNAGTTEIAVGVGIAAAIAIILAASTSNSAPVTSPVP